MTNYEMVILHHTLNKKQTTMFSAKKAMELIESMLDQLYEKDNFLLTKHLNITERSITHRMAMHLQNLLPDGLHVDCEYNRMAIKVGNEIIYTEGDYFAKTVCLSEGSIPDDDDSGSRVFPDIIVHRRGTPENYIIVEVKIEWKNGKAGHDIKKLNAYKKDLRYLHAFYVQLGEKRADVRVKKIQ